MASPKRGLSQHVKILLGLVLGAGAGLAAEGLASRWAPAREPVRWLSEGVAHPIGQIFLRLLFLVVIPLVFASLATGVARLGDLRKLGSIGARTLAFFVLTSAFSAVLGIALCNYFEPGKGFDLDTRTALMAQFGGDAAKVGVAASQRDVTTLLGVVNQVLDAFLPRNLLAAVVGVFKQPKSEFAQLGSAEMLPLILFALLFGLALTGVAERRRETMLEWLETISDAMVGIVNLAMKLAPYAVFCLIFRVSSQFGLEVLEKLAFYMTLVLGSYVVQLFVLYPVLVRLLARTSPLEFLKRCIPVMATAFSTSSSNATLPTSLRIAQTELGVRPSLAGFVLPLGATMNMNGTALFEGVVVLFIAQIFGVELSLAQQIQVVVLCVISAIGAAGVPGGSLPLMMIVMANVGVPADGIAIILGVDRLLDMGRTVINVMGDLVCAVYVERVEATSRGSRTTVSP